jgi:hypothetical protein
MPAKKPGYSLRVTLSPENIENLKRIAQLNEIPQSLILDRIAAAGIAAIDDNKGHLKLPLRFEMVDQKYQRIAARNLQINEK